MIGEMFRRLKYLLNRGRMDQELADDLEFHREMAGRMPDHIPLGNALRLREESREAWGWMWLDRLGQDLRYTLRQLRNSPGFSLMAILMLAVGTGVNIAAFGFFDFLVLRPLNVKDPATLVRFHRRSPEAYSFVLPYPEMAFVRDYSRSLSAVLSLHSTRLNLDPQNKAVKVHFVSANWFRELGATATMGRLLDPVQDEAPGAAPVVILGHQFWVNEFGGDPGMVGRVVRFHGKAATVAGIAAPEFTGLSLEQPEMWAPLDQQPYFVDGSHLLTDLSPDGAGVQMWGRLRPGVSPRAAQEEMTALVAELRRQHPREIWQNEGLPAEPSGYAQSLMISGRRGTGPEERDPIYPVFAMAGTLTLLILTVACGNLGSLLLARGVARSREIAIRTAVGAGRGRLIRQLLTESLVLALTGSVAGLGLSYLLLRGLMRAVGSPAWLDPTPDWRMLAFAIGIAVSATLIFGLTPALQLVRQRHRAGVFRQALIAAQVAASCVLLIVAALVVRALDHAVTAHPGFDYQHMVSIDPQLGNHGYTAARARVYLEQVKERVAAIPGVESVALTDTAPFGNKTSTAGLEDNGHKVSTQISSVEPDYFTAMRIPLLAGRYWLPREEGAIVVSQSFASRFWPGESPVGKVLTFGEDAAKNPRKHTVVGVVRDARTVKLEDPDLAQLYFPLSAADLPGASLVVRTAGAPESVMGEAGSLLKGVDPLLFPTVTSLRDALRRKLEVAEYGALAIGVLGATALLLACFGIVGVVAFSVSQRRKEIGIRMALGASSGHVLSVVLRQFATPVAAGLVLGVVAAGGLSQILRRVLYGISGVDALAYSGAVLIFLFTAGIAAGIPARRALRVDPVGSLRDDG